MKTQRYGHYGDAMSGPRCNWCSPYAVGPSFCTVLEFAGGAFEIQRENGSSSDTAPGSGKAPRDGNYTWIKGSVGCDVVSGVKDAVWGVKNEGGYYEYEVRYDAGPGDLAWFEEKDRNYLTRILKEGNLRKQEPDVWYLRGLEHAEGTNIGEWWSQKLKLPNIAALLDNAREAESELKGAGSEAPWEKEAREHAEHERAIKEREEAEKAETDARRLKQEKILTQSKAYRCTKSKKIMLQPCVAADGESYEREEVERWFRDHDTSPVTDKPLPRNPDGSANKQLFPNNRLQSMISRFLDLHPTLWDTDEVYYSRRLAEALVRALHEGNTTEIARIMGMDKRFLTRSLNDEGQHALSIALAVCSAAVQAAVTALGDRLGSLPEMKVDRGVGFFCQAVRHLGAAGAGIIARALKWGNPEIQAQFDVAIESDDERLAEVCLDLGANINADKDGAGSLHRVIRSSSDELLGFLLERGANPELPNSEGDTALLHAVRQNDPEAVNTLLLRKVNIEATDRNGHTALHLAFNLGHLELVPQLVAAGADLEKRDDQGRTALMRAVMAKRQDLAQLMLDRPEKPAEIKATDHARENVLHLAAPLGDTEQDHALALFLLDRGVAGLGMNKQGKNPKEVAFAAGNLAMAEAIDERILDLRVAARGLSPAPHALRPPPMIPGLHQEDTVPFSELSYGRYLGEGAFSKVYQGAWKGREVAIKELLAPGLSHQAAEELGREASIMKQLRHPNILPLLRVCIEPGHYSLVMEYAPKGSLYQVLHSAERLEWPVRWNIALGTARGVEHLHDHDPQILHRDLKSPNVLLDNRLVPKITDFGLSKVRTETRTTLRGTHPAAAATGGSHAVPTAPGTLAWMAPELFALGATYGRACDIYSLGLIFWELASRRAPWEGAASDDLIALWLREGKREAIPDGTPPSYSTLIARCWAQRAEDRPKISDAVQVLNANKKEVLPVDIPEAYTCPITGTGELMKDPVVDNDGHTFERRAIQDWLKHNATCPISRAHLVLADLAPNYALRDAIEKFKEDNPILNPDGPGGSPAPGL